MLFLWSVNWVVVGVSGRDVDVQEEDECEEDTVSHHNHTSSSTNHIKNVDQTHSIAYLFPYFLPTSPQYFNIKKWIRWMLKDGRMGPGVDKIRRISYIL